MGETLENTQAFWKSVKATRHPTKANLIRLPNPKGQWRKWVKPLDYYLRSEEDKEKWDKNGGVIGVESRLDIQVGFRR